ncbi:MAG: DAK2 domain-containing protein, partial [Chloroflexi bacterium]|nr:DAK2 domain-containing protein [Chloroflexota bacterium]
MERTTIISGQNLRDMFEIATNWLEKSAADIDALNVFPVPDGDCGTNMLLTMRSSLEEAFRAADHDISAIAQAMAKGALMGARGNSGVILSQIWRGIAETLQDKETANSQDIAAALVRGSEMAYKGLSNPVEGTMLTVMREAAAAAQQLASDGSSDVIAVLEATVDASRDSVANTPNLLSVLKEAGVVDAGGEGLYTLFDGALRYLRGEAEEMKLRKPQLVVADIHAAGLPQMEVEPEVPYGYCTEFLLKGESLKPDEIRAKLEKKGQSVIVVGDEMAVRVHIHTLRPGTILNYASRVGTMHDVNIRNMDEQHQDFLKMQKERMPAINIATVAVVSGDGLAEVFRSLGVAGIVPGGQTMNPSTRDLLQTAEA